MFYDRLKKICDEKGIKITPLLKELKISQGNTEKWKNGAIPTGAILIILVEKLNCSTDYLLERTNTP